MPATPAIRPRCRLQWSSRTPRNRCFRTRTFGQSSDSPPRYHRVKMGPARCAAAAMTAQKAGARSTHSLDQPRLTLDSAHFVDGLQHHQQIVRELRQRPDLIGYDPALTPVVVVIVLALREKGYAHNSGRGFLRYPPRPSRRCRAYRNALP